MTHRTGLRPTFQRRGIAVVEFAIIAPLLLLLLVGIWEVGRMLEAHQLLSNAAREGGRQASTGLKTNAEIKDVVLQYLAKAGVKTTNVKVVVTVNGSSASESLAAAQLDVLAVKVTMPIRDVVWYTLEIFTAMDDTLESTSVWYSMKNKDYPSPSDPVVDY